MLGSTRINYCPTAHEAIWSRTPHFPGEHYKIGEPIPKAWGDLWGSFKDRPYLDSLELLPLEVASWLDEVVTVSGGGDGENWRRVRAPPPIGARHPPTSAPQGQRSSGEEEEETSPSTDEVYFHPKHLLIYFSGANLVFRIMLLTQGKDPTPPHSSGTKWEGGKRAPPPLGSAPLGGPPEDLGQARPAVVSAGVLLTRLRGGQGEPEVLAIRRRTGPGAAWEFPKGRLGPTDRNKLACAFRELAEEAGVALEPPTHLPVAGVERYSTRWGDKEVYWFHHHVAGGKVTLGEHESMTKEVRFVSLGELRRLLVKGGPPSLAEEALQRAGNGGTA